MKKVIKIAFLALSVLFISCNDATDIVQESELNENAAYNSIADLQRGVGGVYSTYAPDAGSNGTADILLFGDLFTDNVKRGIGSTGQGSTEASFLLQAGDDFPIRLWSNRYATINFANRVLENIDRLESTFTENELLQANQLRAQLYGMRALAHLDLLQYYSPEYLNPSALSVPILDFVPELTDVLQRNTVGEVFTFINNDLNQAMTLFGDNEGTFPASEVYYMRPDAIMAVQARVALFQGDYTRAEALASELRQAYPISTGDAYAGIWQADQVEDTECIFVLQRILGNNTVGQLFAFNQSSADGGVFYEMSNQLYDQYTSNDVRKTLFVDPTSVTGGSERILVIDKYPGTANGLLLNSIKLIRSSEMLLIDAECKIRNGNIAGAVSLVNALKAARGDINLVTAATYADRTAALGSIMDERRKELCFEGHRYLDYKRIGREIGRNVERDPRDCASFSAPCELPVSDYRFTVPIPQTEISANPTIQQNPGY